MSLLRRCWVVLFVLEMSAALLAAEAPAYIATDPPADAAHPARMEVVHIPTHGVEINGLLYVASGVGPHPTFVFFHGLPGNEQNLDLAQAIRRAGWNVLTLHYRGSWGSPGTYSYAHLIEDGQAALAFARDPKHAAAFAIDVQRIVLGGHSSGGFVAVQTAAHAPTPVQGLVLISASDDASQAVAASRDAAAWKRWVKESYSDSMETLVAKPEALAKEALAHHEAWSFTTAAKSLTALPVLVITANDGLQAESEALATAIHAQGGAAPALLHMVTDHPYSDHRIALQTAVVEWLLSRFPK